MTKHLNAEVMSDGKDLFVIVEGIRIAKRGAPGTPQAETWVSLEPGWRVLDGKGLKTIVIERDGARLH